MDFTTLHAAVTSAITTFKQTTVAQLTALFVALRNHVLNIDNPHGVTAEQLGLGQVRNWPPATKEQAADGSVGSAYMTPASTRDFCEAGLYAALVDVATTATTSLDH
jgi:hypothetical protein